MVCGFRYSLLYVKKLCEKNFISEDRCAGGKSDTRPGDGIQRSDMHACAHHRQAAETTCCSIGSAVAGVLATDRV